MLEHFKDLLPQTDVFVFASPGAGEMWNAHLSLVTINAKGKFEMQAIPKWGIAGEETDEYKTNEFKDIVPIKPGDSCCNDNFVPIGADDAYRTHVLEQRPGFRAFDAILTVGSEKSNPVHVVYWVGLEVRRWKNCGQRCAPRWGELDVLQGVASSIGKARPGSFEESPEWPRLPSGYRDRTIQRAQPLSLLIIPPKDQTACGPISYIGKRALAFACARWARTARRHTRTSRSATMEP